LLNPDIAQYVCIDFLVPPILQNYCEPILTPTSAISWCRLHYTDLHYSTKDDQGELRKRIWSISKPTSYSKKKRYEI